MTSCGICLSLRCCTQHNAFKVHPCHKWQDFLMAGRYSCVCVRARAPVRMCASVSPCAHRCVYAYHIFFHRDVFVFLSSYPRGPSDSPYPELTLSRGPPQHTHFALDTSFAPLPSHKLRGHCRLPFSVACSCLIKSAEQSLSPTVGLASISCLAD